MDRTDKAARYLRRPRTAAALADHLGVSRPTAYQIIAAVRARRVDTVRQGAKGPQAGRFQVAS